jgi:glyoxalase family protein
MALEGLHHVTAICADAARNVDFYARVLGLRLVKKTVNFDSPDVYHLYYGDEAGRPGSILTFFEFPGIRPGRAGAGMAHTICWRVGSSDALAFWLERLAAEGIDAERGGRVVRFADPEGLRHALVVVDVPDERLAAFVPDIPDEHAILGLHGVRAYADAEDIAATEPVLEALGIQRDEKGRWLAAGAERQGQLTWDEPPEEAAIPGAGTIHHLAWSAADDAELAALREQIASVGGRPTAVIDRQYFHSVYFRPRAGVLFELASRDIGFGVDEPLERLGQALKLPPQYESRRPELEANLTPLTNPRAAA